MASGQTIRAVVVLLLTVALTALAGCGGSGLALPADDEWVRTSDTVTQVSVELPGTTAMQSSTLPLPTGEQMAARTWVVELGDDGAASLTVVDTQGQPMDLTGALAGAAANIAGVVESQTMTSQNGRAAIDGRISISPQGTDGVVHMRIVDAGGSVVILQALGLASETDALEQLQQRMIGTLVVP